MRGSPPQMETMGALHSSAAPRQSSRFIMSLIDVEYSRIRPHPVQVRLQVCKGSSCRTVAKRLVPRIFCPIMYAAILLVSARGNLIGARIVTRAPALSIGGEPRTRPDAAGKGEVNQEGRWGISGGGEAETEANA